MRVLVLDPSGNFTEGKGITGWAVFEDGKLEEFGTLDASKYTSQESYWYAHAMLIEDETPHRLVMESYRVFAHKSKQQINSTMETPQLIGYLRMVCWDMQIPIIFQDPQDKVRVSDEILTKEGLFELKGNKHYCLGRPTVIHSRDAIRHGVFWHRYGKGIRT